MYAKIDTDTGATLFDVGEECSHGREIFFQPNTDDVWIDKLAAGHTVIHVVGSLDVEPKPSSDDPIGVDQPGPDDYWVVNWVSWHGARQVVSHFAITVWPIYILNGAGKTIDRVR